MTTRHGRVVAAGGAPVADAIVTVEWGTAPTPEIGLIADASGEFRLGLPPGQFRVRATAPDGSTGTAEVNGADQTRIIVQLGAVDR